MRSLAPGGLDTELVSPYGLAALMESLIAASDPMAEAVIRL